MTGDYTDLLQENAQLKEAYEKAVNTGKIITHIARSLARGYTDLYYVNMDTDELIEYHTDDDYGVLSEVRRSADFFEGCRRDVKRRRERRPPPDRRTQQYRCTGPAGDQL